MEKEKIELIVKKAIENYCNDNDIYIEDVIDRNTPLIGSNRILDSLGLVSVIVDIETAFLDENIEIFLTSDAAMSCRISPFRTVGALCNFIAKQFSVNENE